VNWLEVHTEISGFGGQYEQTCRDVVDFIVSTLTEHPLLSEKRLRELIIKKFPDLSGAQFHTTLRHAEFIFFNGWADYVRAMNEEGRT
jgi:hypothetical protein